MQYAYSSRPILYASPDAYNGYRSLYAGSTPFARSLTLDDYSDDHGYPVIDMPPSTLGSPYFDSVPVQYYPYPVNTVYALPATSSYYV